MAITKYQEIIDMAYRLGIEGGPPKTEVLKSIDDSLKSNVGRIVTLAVLPAFLMHSAQIKQLTFDRALFNITGKLDDPGNDKDVVEKVKAEQQKISTIFTSLPPVAQGGKYAITIYNFFDSSALELDHSIDNSAPSELKTAMSSLYAGLIMAAYSALETNASDLWLASVNARPKSLAMNVLLPSPSKKSDQSRAFKQQEPTLRIADLIDYGFDVSSSMGYILKSRNQVSFESVYSIRDAYERSFRIPEDPNNRTSNSLNHLFDSSIADIKTLECIRNLIAHRNGVVDRKFRDEIKEIASDLYVIKENDPLPLDGSIVRKYVESAIKFSRSLLRIIDDWLEKHPT